MRSLKEFLQKMEWEGGLLGLMEYGGADLVDEYDLPEQFKSAWKKVAAGYQTLVSLTDNWYMLMDANGDGADSQ